MYLVKIEGYIKSFMAWTVQFKKAADGFVENTGDGIESIESEKKKIQRWFLGTTDMS